MTLLTHAAFKKANVPNGWCIRPGDGGGLKLTYSEFRLGSMITDQKRAFKGVVPTKLHTYTAPIYGDKKSQGIETQITEWTIHDEIIYVSDGIKIYRLLMAKSNGKREDTFDGVVRKLTQCNRITRV